MRYSDSNHRCCGSARHRLGAAWLTPLTILWTLTAIGETADPPPQAPPPAPPVQRRLAPPMQQPGSVHPTKDGTILYSIGDPTDDEQLYLEFINRARANPPAEGVRLATTTDRDIQAAFNYFSVDTNLLVNQFNAIAPVPPLAFNSSMIAAARGHSAWMYQNNQQNHYEGTIGPGDRLDAVGYNWSIYGENIFTTAKSDWSGHAGFNVDWGFGPGGMQTPPGHRENIHSPDFREIGIGVLYGSYGTNGSVGPQLVTQDFGDRFGAVPLVTGVVYYDLNGNGFYDTGEGIGGITVNVSGSSYYAITSASGGYAVPSGNGSPTVAFSGLGIAKQQVVTIANGANVKVDCVPPYQPPVISGTTQPAVNSGSPYTFTAVGGADSYQWLSARRALFTATEGAENGLANVSTNVSPGYSVVVSGYRASGSYAFHLLHPLGSQGPAQTITLTRSLRARTNAQLYFSSFLGLAASNEVALAQISTNSSATWFDIWSQAGNDASSDTQFMRRTVSLAALAGKDFLVRFSYTANPYGSCFTNTTVGFGFYLDDISFANVDELTGLTTNNVPSGTSFTFSPTVAGDYSLRVRPHLVNHYLDFGPDLLVTATNLPSIRITQIARSAPNQFRVDFLTANLPAATFKLFRADQINGSWTQDASAGLTTITPGSQYRFTTTSAAGMRYFQVRSS